ncbi:hypothetical protein AXG93_4280s1050 [Marchantia polymorpha subsp. ruderalis]|uniref:Uncharacterized protein n=1 Tax=Marchantia polymorpha subsp. ruderalis TaxID=1480154 RepID=A0A176WP81_MARPO|nr:hypothetical protein AXG93_4280s1050 [Marchantia polymorpha subsp. ruderalis]
MDVDPNPEGENQSSALIRERCLITAPILDQIGIRNPDQIAAGHSLARFCMSFPEFPPLPAPVSVSVRLGLGAGTGLGLRPGPGLVVDRDKLSRAHGIAHQERSKQKNDDRKKQKNSENRVGTKFDTSPAPAAAAAAPPMPDLLYAPRMNLCSSFPAAAILWAHHHHKHQAVARLPACLLLLLLLLLFKRMWCDEI